MPRFIEIYLEILYIIWKYMTELIWEKKQSCFQFNENITKWMKQTVFFTRTCDNRIYSIGSSNIGFPGQFQTFSNQFNVSSNQFRPKCDRGKISEFKFVFGYSNSTTQRPNCKLRQPIWHNEQWYSSMVIQIRPFVKFPSFRSFKFVNEHAYSK